MQNRVTVFATDKDGFIEEIMEFHPLLRTDRELKKVLNRWIKRGYILTFYDAPADFIPFILQERKRI